MRRKREPEVAIIESVTHDGRGIAAVTGKKVFVAGALPGEEVRFLRRKRRRNFDEAELLEVLQAAPQRQTPRCAAFGNCGGCSLQHVSLQEQRDIKLQALRDSLSRIGGVEPEQWLPPLFDDSEGGAWQYRRRARLAVKYVEAKGRALVGFRERHAPFVADMHRCEILAGGVGLLLDPLSELIGGLSIRARLPQIEVAVGDNVTTLVFRVLDPPSAADAAAITDFARTHGLQVFLQTGGGDSVAAHFPQPAEALRYRLEEFSIDIEFEPTDFVQVNGRMNQRMVSRAIELLQVSAEHRVLDLYCGIGNFSLPLARTAGFVLGLEGEQRQVSRARENAARNGIDNAEFQVADLSALDGGEGWLGERWDRMLLDPARSGAAEVIARIAVIAPSRIVYVSCHPGTLARDAGSLLRDAGYRLEAAGIIDMFAHTGHIESLAVFAKD